METIRTYLDNMFQTWPQTEEVLKIKSELLSDMTDKYNEMKAEGKSENEAVGIVISEFGNIDELMHEMGVSRQEEPDDAYQNFRHVDKEEAESFIRVKEGNGKRIGTGIASILFGVAGLTLLTSAVENIPGGEEGFLGRVMSLSGMLLLIFCIIAGVALFIYSDTQENRYKYLKNAFHIDDSLRNELMLRREDGHSAYTISVIVGVCLCIASAIPVISVSFLAPDNDFMGAVALTFTLTLVGAAVYLFVSFGEKKEAYDKLLQEGDFTIEKKKKNKIIGMVASIVWPIATVGFLLRGFLADDWASAMVIYPVVGILFAAFSAAVKSRA